MSRAARVSIVLGLMLATTVGLLARWAAGHDVSTRFFLAEIVDRWDLRTPFVDQLLAPPPLYADQPLPAAVVAEHPRILLPSLRSWPGTGVAPVMAERLSAHARLGSNLADYKPCGRGRSLDLVVCWLSSGDTASIEKAISLLLHSNPVPPRSGARPGNYWQWAVAYDLMTLYPGFSAEDRERINGKLRAALLLNLRDLDDESASLWHARASLAAEAWLLAVAMDKTRAGDAQLIRRACGHFRVVMEALALTEGWPEGYTYWINSRALLMSLAIAAYVNGLALDATSAADAREVLRRTGLWMVYMTRPDDRAAPLGDEGSRLDLKDETRRVIDVIAQVTADPVFVSYSHYLEHLHGPASYSRRYRGSFLLLHNPLLAPLEGVKPGVLQGFEHHLPAAELFGRDAMNLVIARSGWGPDDTFITLKAGHRFTHHGHLDAGHFTLFKGSPLAVSNSRYEGRVAAPHRLAYGVRTVAKNTLLIAPGEGGDTGSAGSGQPDRGQRAFLTTGSRIRSVRQWRENLYRGVGYARAELQAYDYQPARYVYVRVDMADAYRLGPVSFYGNETRGSEIIREFLYLFDEDRLLIRDRVEADDADMRVTWLLHTTVKPTVEEDRVVAGLAEAGILETRSDSALIKAGRGQLLVQRLLPWEATMRLVGGIGYEYYVERPRLAAPGAGAPGAAALSGENHPPDPSRLTQPGAGGHWRLEFEPLQIQKNQEILVSLSPRLTAEPTYDPDAPEGMLTIAHANGVRLLESSRRSVLFMDQSTMSGGITLKYRSSRQNLLVVGGSQSVQLALSNGQSKLTAVVKAGEVKDINLMRSRQVAGDLSIVWQAD